MPRHAPFSLMLSILVVWLKKTWSLLDRKHVLHGQICLQNLLHRKQENTHLPARSAILNRCFKTGMEAIREWFALEAGRRDLISVGWVHRRSCKENHRACLDVHSDAGFFSTLHVRSCYASKRSSNGSRHAARKAWFHGQWQEDSQWHIYYSRLIINFQCHCFFHRVHRSLGLRKIFGDITSITCKC